MSLWNIHSKGNGKREQIAELSNTRHFAPQFALVIGQILCAFGRAMQWANFS